MPSPTVSPGSRFPARALALAAAVAAPAVALTADARAIDYRWKSATSGSFSDQTRWEPNGWPSQQDSARIDRTGAPYTVTGGASADTLVLDSPDLTFQLGPVAGTGGLSVRDLQLKSGLLRTAGTAEISDWSFGTPFTITNDATIHVTSGSSLTIRGKPATSSISPLSTFVHGPGGHLQIDGSLKLNHVAFMNHGGDFGGPARITLDGAFLSTLDGVTHSNVAFVVRGWSYLRAPAGYANVNPTGQTIVLRGNSDQPFDTGQMRVDHGFTNYGTMVMEVDPDTRNDWTYLTVYNTTPTSPRLMTNLGTIVTNPGPKLDGPREIWGDLLNRPGATVTANGNFRVSGAARNEGGMSVAADRRMSFGSLTQAAGTIDVRGTLSAANFAYLGGSITGGGTVHLGARSTTTTLEWGNPSLPVPDVTFVFGGRTHIPKDIPAGYTVVARAQVRDSVQTVTVGPDFTNHGTFSLDVSPGIDQPPVLKPTDPNSTDLQRFINRGTFAVTRDSDRNSPAYVNQIDGHMLNAAGAEATFAGTTIVSGDLVNEGALAVAAGKTLRAGLNTTNNNGFVQAAGTLEVNGTLLVEKSFTYRGGTITGNPIEFRGGTLINDADDGNMDFIVTSYMKLAPAPGRAAVLAGQKLSTHPLGGGVRITGPVAWTNEGTIELRSSSGIAAESAFATADGRITNNGTIRIMDLSGRIEGTMVNNGSIVKNRGDAIFTKGLENVGTLTVEQEARVNITGGPTTNSGTITLGPAATLTFGGDVTNTGRLVLDPTSSVNLPTASFLHRAPDAAERDEAVRHYTDLIRAGRLHSWIGQPRPHTGLALAPVDETELLIRNTYNGDANLDGLVNADDYFRIDSNFLAPPPEPTYAHGDFNYDGTINADDYFLIDSAFLAQGTPLAGSGDSPPLMSAAAVPEPSALSLLVIAAGSSTRRSRDRR